MQIKANAANVSQAANNFAAQSVAVSRHADLAYPLLSRRQGGAPTIRRIDDPVRSRSIVQSPGAVSKCWAFAYAKWANG